MDTARALGLVQRVLGNTSPAAQPLHPLARLLEARLLQQRRLEDQLDRQAQQLRDTQRRNDQLSERLEAVRAFATLPDLVRAHATERPNAIAAADTARRLSWSELDAMMDRIAARLQADGFAKGDRRGAVGLSTRHVLALTNRGGATTRELLDLAREVRDEVERRFSIRLVNEPTVVGAEW